jgi:hypothetical protein
MNVLRQQGTFMGLAPDSVNESPSWEHRVFLSDGTLLTQRQWDLLLSDGSLVLPDGRVLEI